MSTQNLKKAIYYGRVYYGRQPYGINLFSKWRPLLVSAKVMLPNVFKFHDCWVLQEKNNLRPMRVFIYQGPIS